MSKTITTFTLGFLAAFACAQAGTFTETTFVLDTVCITDTPTAREYVANYVTRDENGAPLRRRSLPITSTFPLAQSACDSCFAAASNAVQVEVAASPAPTPAAPIQVTTPRPLGSPNEP